MNTEIWLSDFLWPFFANRSYDEIMSAVLNVLLESAEADDLMANIDVPETVIESFGSSCRRHGLIDSSGMFRDPHKLVQFFCG